MGIVARPQKGGEAGTVQQSQISKIHLDRADGLIQRLAQNLIQVIGH